MEKKLPITLVLYLFISYCGFAQRWVDEMQKPDANLYQVQGFFEQYWSTRDVNEKGKGYKAFKRWEDFVAPRVYPSGDLSLLNLTAINYQAFLRTAPKSPAQSGKPLGSNNNLIASATWTAMGPHGPMNGNGNMQKSGRLTFLTIDPTNTLNLWVGAPSGGLWNSTNGGATWSTNTDLLPVTGCSDLAIDPTNTNIMYLATGDGIQGDSPSIGVLKSTDGGVTWAATGLVNSVSAFFKIRRLIINPSNTQILIAATNTGIYRTTNGGTTWAQVSPIGTFDCEFKPGDPNTVYASGGLFLLSTNGGATFSTVNSGLPNNIERIAIAVTPADANYVYLILSSAINSGFLGLYRSTTSGTTFSMMSSSTPINVLGWNSFGTDVGGQGWYDLCIAASPLDKDEIVTGGVNVWRSLNGGANWALYGHQNGNGAPFTHADQHELEYAPDGTLFNGNDGTLYRRTSTSWLEISGLMNISQIYKLGLSTLTANKWITGHQDNGSNMWTGTSYNAIYGADGMDCFFDRTNDQNVFFSSQNGGFRRSTNGGVTSVAATSGLSGTAPWVTVWKQDPQTSTTLYAGRQNLFKSTNLAVSWSALTALPSGGSINEFAIAPSNNQVIYVLKNNGIYKTTNGGSTWTTVTNGVPVSLAAPEFISIDPSDPNNAWVVLSGYSAGNKVFMTTNGGTSWTNFSANLPNIPANCCVYQSGTNDMVYVGMDVGIYFRNNTSPQWTLYNTGLPNVPISDLEISPVSPTLLHASTYGRGVWVASVYAPSAVPATTFAAPVVNCAGAAMTFSDQSDNTPSSWSWSVIPNAGVSINSPTLSNPSITFNSTGTYTVYLQPTNSIGQGSVNAQVITVIGSPTLQLPVASKTACPGSLMTFSVNGANTYTWSNNGGTGQTGTYYPTSTFVYTVSGTTNSCTSISTVTAVVHPAPVVGITGPNLSCGGQPVTLTGTGALNYTWSTGGTNSTEIVSPMVTTSYSIAGVDANGCKSIAYKLVTTYPLPAINASANNTLICANEEIVLIANGGVSYIWNPGNQAGPSLTVTPSSNIVYTVIGTDLNGCSQSSALSIAVSICDGISTYQVSKESGYSIFPNPTTGKLSINAKTEQVGTVQLEVLDLTGRLVLSQQLQFNGDSAEINLGNLTAGSYLMKLESNISSEVIRIIKE